MKLKITGIICLLFLSIFTLKAQEVAETEGTGLDGDNFSLEGALELFKNAKSLEDFEKSLNSEDNHVNNLDLNEDGDVDYVRVKDIMDGDAHAIVLQVPVNEAEMQDVAVIGIEKKGDENAILQIVGDADLYGEPTYVEPFQEEVKQTGKGGPSGAEVSVDFVLVNVWFWPSVRFIYAPAYVPYVSPWAWNYYPRYWKPWRPLPWRYYYPKRVRYNSFARVVTTHRVVHAHKVYAPSRSYSPVVAKRTKARVANHRAAKVNNGSPRAAQQSKASKPGTAQTQKKKDVKKSKKAATPKRSATKAKARKKGKH